MIFIQAVCNKFGPTTIAAFTSAMRIEQLALQPMISFGLSMAVLVRRILELIDLTGSARV